MRETLKALLFTYLAGLNVPFVLCNSQAAAVALAKATLCGGPSSFCGAFTLPSKLLALRFRKSPLMSLGQREPIDHHLSQIPTFQPLAAGAGMQSRLTHQMHPARLY